MTRRESAINDFLFRHSIPRYDVLKKALSDLIDQAESGALKEPLPIHHMGDSGHLIVHPDGRREQVS